MNQNRPTLEGDTFFGLLATIPSFSDVNQTDVDISQELTKLKG
jgi:hypothetical protein